MVSLEDNKALVQRFVEEVLNDGNLDAINELCVPGSMFAGGIAGQVRAMKSPFPDMRHTIDEMVAEGDKVAVRVSQQGTNTGPMVGAPGFGRFETPVPPTGNSISITGINVFKIADDRIVSYAMEMDQVGMLRQLGWTFTPPS